MSTLSIQFPGATKITAEKDATIQTLCAFQTPASMAEPACLVELMEGLTGPVCALAVTPVVHANMRCLASANSGSARTVDIAIATLDILVILSF